MERKRKVRRIAKKMIPLTWWMKTASQIVWVRNIVKTMQSSKNNSFRWIMTPCWMTSNASCMSIVLQVNSIRIKSPKELIQKILYLTRSLLKTKIFKSLTEWKYSKSLIFSNSKFRKCKHCRKSLRILHYQKYKTSRRCKSRLRIK